MIDTSHGDRDVIFKVPLEISICSIHACAINKHPINVRGGKFDCGIETIVSGVPDADRLNSA